MVGRIRTIKPEFSQSETIGRLSRDARLLFLLLFNITDDEGRLRAAPSFLAGTLYPYDDDLRAAEVAAWLDELERAGCVRRYEAGGNSYAVVCNWSEHQKINRPSPSRLPAPPEASVSDHGSFTEDSVNTQCRIKIHDPDPGTGPDPGTQAEAPPDPAPPPPDEPDRFEEFWETFDRKVAKPKAEAAWRRALKGQPPDLAGAIIERARAYAASTPEKAYRRHPATWLNDRGWEDEIVAKHARGSPAPPRRSFSDTDYRKGGEHNQAI
jgi:hypothetical protein